MNWGIFQPLLMLCVGIFDVFLSVDALRERRRRRWLVRIELVVGILVVIYALFSLIALLV